jgi:hypothetical protein
MKRIVLFAALTLVMAVIVSPVKNVQADACTDQCQSTYNDCISSSDRNYDACYDQAEIDEWGCEDDAYSTYQSCVDTWGWTTWVHSFCEEPYYNAVQRCEDNFNSAASQCDSLRTTAESTCQGQLDTCLSHCP